MAGHNNTCTFNRIFSSIIGLLAVASLAACGTTDVGSDTSGSSASGERTVSGNVGAPGATVFITDAEGMLTLQDTMLNGSSPQGYSMIGALGSTGGVITAPCDDPSQGVSCAPLPFPVSPNVFGLTCSCNDGSFQTGLDGICLVDQLCFLGACNDASGSGVAGDEPGDLCWGVRLNDNGNGTGDLVVITDPTTNAFFDTINQVVCDTMDICGATQDQLDACQEVMDTTEPSALTAQGVTVPLPTLPDLQEEFCKTFCQEWVIPAANDELECCGTQQECTDTFCDAYVNTLSCTNGMDPDCDAACNILP